LKTILRYVSVPAFLLFAVLTYLAVQEYNISSYVPPPPGNPGDVKVGTEKPPDGSGGTEKVKPPDSSYGTETVRPPRVEQVPPDVTGRWSYSVEQPDGRVIHGEMQIANMGGFLQIVAVAAYPMIWTDGLMHQFREQSQWVGRVYGGRLEAQAAQINYVMDGYPLPPERGQWQLSLAVAADGSGLQGEVTNAYGQTGRVAARRP
jgi:hypothetical protein